MHIRRTLKYATIALVGSGTLSVADAQSSSATLKAIKERGTISVGHRESLIPFSYYDQDQKVVGYSADICSEIIPSIAIYICEIDAHREEAGFSPFRTAERMEMAFPVIDIQSGSIIHGVFLVLNIPSGDQQVRVSVTIGIEKGTRHVFLQLDAVDQAL